LCRSWEGIEDVDGQELGGFGVDGLCPQHLGEALQREGSVLELVVGNVEREEAGRFGNVVLGCIGDEAISQFVEGAEGVKVVYAPVAPIVVLPREA
jgi:hypothetical protein